MQVLDSPDAPRPAPPIIKWYRLYCILMALLFLMGVSAGVALLVNQAAILAAFQGRVSPADLSLRFTIIVGVCGVMCALNFIALFLPRRPWAWMYHIINIALGSGGCALLMIVLLIFWIKPEVQEYFGRSLKSTPPENSDSPSPSTPPL
jgi:hypothetical protein